MKVIAHRGNIDGREPGRENHPDYLQAALWAGFDVELDVWVIDGQFYLGHDKPRFQTNYEFLLRTAGRSWIHAKDVDALKVLLENSAFNVFCHDNDTRTITTKGYIWTRSGEEDFCQRSILLELDNPRLPHSEVAGICTNYANRLAGLLKES